MMVAPVPPGGLAWTDSVLGSALHVDGALIAKVRPLAAGGASAQWCDGRRWDVSDQLKRVKASSSRWFKTVPAAKAAVEAALASGDQLALGSDANV